MKYKRQLVSGMLAISLLTAGTTAFAAESAVRPSKVPQHMNQIKMKSADPKTVDSKTSIEKKNVDNKVLEKSKMKVASKAKGEKKTKRVDGAYKNKASVKVESKTETNTSQKINDPLIKTN